MFCTSYLVVSDFSCVLRGPCSRKLVLAPITLFLFNSPCLVLLQGFKGMVTRSALIWLASKFAPFFSQFSTFFQVIFLPDFGAPKGCPKARDGHHVSA